MAYFSLNEGFQGLGSFGCGEQCRCGPCAQRQAGRASLAEWYKRDEGAPEPPAGPPRANNRPAIGEPPQGPPPADGPGHGPLPYREAIEQMERRAFADYSRACSGVNVLQWLRRPPLSLVEEIAFWEKVITWLPRLFDLKRAAERRAREGRMTMDEARATVRLQMNRVFPPGYALGSLADELARARCALSKVRWQHAARQNRGRTPLERRLHGGLHGFGEPAVAAGPKADFVFDKFVFRLSLVPAEHTPAINALADRIVAIARQAPGPLGTVRLVGHTDFIGAEKYNKALGLMRAKAVHGALATALEYRLRGVTSRIEIVPESRGEFQPATKDTSPAGRERNRRVEVFLALKFAGTPRQRVPDLRLPEDYNPDIKRPPHQQPSPTDRIITTKVPKPQRKCFKPYEAVVKLLRKLLDKALKESRIPPRFHDRIRELAEKRAADLRDDLIDRGLEELELEGRLKEAARRLIVDAIQRACI
jgi:outer membrane protein OmpA-like peptidoglycan-associated protein